MRLAVFDTNVLISAGIRPGSAPAKLVQDWVLEGLVQTVTSPAIVAEYREIARRPKFARYGFPPFWLEFLIDESLHLPSIANTWQSDVPDPGNVPFLALAGASGAWLVTGNVKYFPEAVRHGVQVVTPAEYLAHLESH